MKKYIYILLAALSLGACVRDLDTLPLNATDPIAEYVYGKAQHNEIAQFIKSRLDTWNAAEANR